MELKRWDPVDRLTSEEAIAFYIEAALEDGDPQLIAACFADVERARAKLPPRKDAIDADAMSRSLRALQARGLKVVPADEPRAAAE